MPLAITPTFSPWTHTSDDSYIYQLSLVLATASVSFFMILYSQFSVVLPLYSPARMHSIVQYVRIDRSLRFIRQHDAAAVFFFDSMMQQQWCHTGHLPKKSLASDVLMAPSSVSGGCKGIHRCGRYQVSSDLDLSADEGKILHFVPPRRGDRLCTGELIPPFNLSLIHI